MMNLKEINEKAFMSLVKCKECGNKISSLAKQCPQCGYKKKNLGFWGVIFILALIGYGVQTFEDRFGSNEKVKSVNKSTTSKVTENKINQAGRDALQNQYNDPGYVESGFPQKESFWIMIKSPPTGDSARIYAEVVCRQAKEKYNVKGFTITIWGLYDKKKYGKARCY